MKRPGSRDAADKGNDHRTESTIASKRKKGTPTKETEALGRRRNEAHRESKRERERESESVDGNENEETMTKLNNFSKKYCREERGGGSLQIQRYKRWKRKQARE